MEKSNKRGKIPQSDWPLIMARYEAGETLASIARTYDCSPPAISYVVSKSRARQPDRDSSAVGQSGPESQLIKGTGNEPAETAAGRRSRLDAPAAHGGAERRTEAMSTEADSAASAPQLGNGRDPRIPRGTDGLPRDGSAERGPQPSHPQPPGGAGNGRVAPVGTGQRPPSLPPLLRSETDTRHRLHLSLGNGAPSHNGSSDLEFPPSARPGADDGRPAHAPIIRPPHPVPSRPAAPGFSEDGPVPAQPFHQNGKEAGLDALPRKEGAAAFIDHELRARVDGDIAVFLAAFDAALIQDTQENRSALREATDRLLRAGARTRIELERLEARVPLTAQDRGGSDPGAWRYR
jgi:hypothetical protein